MAVVPCSEIFIVSQVTATTTTPSVTFVCFGASASMTTVKIAPTSVGLEAASGQYDVFLLPPLILRDTIRDIVNLDNVLQQKPQIPSQAYANYAMGPSQVRSFLELS